MAYPIDGWDDDKPVHSPPRLCWWGFHRWPKWEPAFYSQGYGTIQQRTCARCGYTSVMFLTSAKLPDPPQRECTK